MDKKQRRTVNLINKTDNKCFQYSITAALNHGEIAKIKLYIDKYNWEWINYPSEKDYWKEIEKNKWKFALNVLFDKKEKIHSAFVSKNNSNPDKQVIILMDPNDILH